MIIRHVFLSGLMLFTVNLCSMDSIDAQNSWIRTGSALPSINMLAVRNNGHIFAISGDSIYCSSDDGVTWIPKNIPPNPLVEGGLIGLGITMNGTLLVGSFYNGLWRSTDEGTSWTKVSDGMRNPVAFFSNDSGHVFIATSVDGVFRSINDGISWDKICTIPANDIVIDQENRIFISGVGSTVYRSNDGGSTWLSANIGLPNPFTFVATLSVNSHNDIFLGGDAGIFRSLDNGDHWSPTNYGLSIYSTGKLLFDSSGIIYCLSGRTIYCSSDNGDSWTQIGRGVLGEEVRAILVLGGNRLLACTNSGHVYRRDEILTTAPMPPVLLSPINNSTDISTSYLLSWNPTASSNSYRLHIARDSNFSQIVFDSSGITGTSAFIQNLNLITKYYWHVNGTNEEGTSGWSYVWNFTTVYPPITYPMLLSPRDEEIDVVINPALSWMSVISSLAYSVQVASDSTFNAIIFENDNVNDTTIRTPLLQQQTRYFWRVRTIRNDSISEWSPYRCFTTSTSLFSGRFPLGIGNSWTIASMYMSTPISYTLKQVEKDTILADGRSYAAIRNYGRPIDSTLWTPQNWEFLRQEGNRVYKYPDSLLVDFDITTGGYLSGTDVYCMGDYRGTWLGRSVRILIFSSNGYDDWTYGDSVGYGVIHESSFQNYFPVYVIGARIDGVEYGTILSISSPRNTVPAGILLYQNYPNPFNPSTTIAYSLPKAEHVTLKVFNLLGEEVQTLVDEKKSPGNYQTRFDGNNLASGIYFYRIQAASFSKTNKMILLR